MNSANPVRTNNWTVEPFADLSAAFVFFNDPVRLVVLDRLTWYVLELCDGRSEQEIATKVGAVGNATAGAGSVAKIVTDRLGVLRERGLLAVAS